MRLLFVCEANRLRSPTAEDLFRGPPGLEVTSAGISPSAVRPLTPDMVRNADLIIVMERRHRDKIRRHYKVRPGDDRIVALNIPDEYERDDPELIRLLNEKVPLFLARFE